MAVLNPSGNGSPMKPSFAQLRRFLYAAVCTLALSGGAFAQDPGAAELIAAQQAVERADRADADQYAPDMMAMARQQLEQAQRAAGDRRERKQAPILALRAAADADLARAQSEEAVAQAQLVQRRAEVQQLQRQLATGEGH
jgi:pimeloyl-ACP methyl ester carboxylesterase